MCSPPARRSLPAQRFCWMQERLRFMCLPSPGLYGTVLSMLIRRLVQNKNGGGQLKENGEAFLNEVLIMGERLSNVSFAHGVHGDAVGKTIAFVVASLIESKASQE